MTGYVRVTNKRWHSPVKPDEDEVVIDVDRSNPVLGNKHVLGNANDAAERERVIEAYRRDLERDLAAQGPMARAVAEIAQRVFSGEKVCLNCWCAPRACHGDVIAARVMDMVATMDVRVRPSASLR